MRPDQRRRMIMIWLALALVVAAPFAAERLAQELNCHLAAGYPVGEGAPVCRLFGLDIFGLLWTAYIVGGMSLFLTATLFVGFSIVWLLAEIAELRKKQRTSNTSAAEAVAGETTAAPAVSPPPGEEPKPPHN